MNSRTQKIMVRAKQVIAKQLEDENKENSPVNENISIDIPLVDQVLSETLSPEDFSKLIDEAEIIIVPQNDSINEHFLEVIKPIEAGSPKNTEEQLIANIPETAEKETLSGVLPNRQPDITPPNTPTNTAADTEEQNNQKKRKKVKGVNKRIINKRLRMCGEDYLGFTKPRGQRNTFHNMNRPERKLGSRCCCQSKAKKLRCESLTEANRQRVFQKFWSDMNWDQRKVFVCNSVKSAVPKRPKKKDDVSRRSQTYHYELTGLPICKKMYLSTLALGEWSVRNWVSGSENGMTESSENRVSKRKKRLDIHLESTQFLRQFLDNLNKLPSHYCRKDTGKLYLEQIFQSYAQLHRVYVGMCHEENKTPLSVVTLTNTANHMNIALFHPRKDQCDTCFKYKNKNISHEEYNSHIERKNLARSEKVVDKQNAIEGKCHVLTMDVQAVKLAPRLEASTLYYKTKLCCHNFTIFNLKNHHVTCYWFNETDADGQAATYASFLVHYLEEHFLTTKDDQLPIIIYSDGCTAQNRNSILSNALLYLSEKYHRVIIQKFLEKGHTQMECDSVHSAIETALKHKEIYLPSDYLKTTREARIKNPYVAIHKNFDFFLDYGDKRAMKYTSIRPGRSNGPTVTDIRVIQYKDSKIQIKLSFEGQFEDLPTRPRMLDFNTVVFPKLYPARLPIPKKKYDHLQQMKGVMDNDCWPYYDQLPYK